MTLRVALFTETQGVGGSERLVADALEHVDRDAFELVIAGNADPALGQWLSDMTGRALERTTVPVSTYGSTLPVRMKRARDARRGNPSTVLAETTAASVANETQQSKLEAVVTYGQMPANLIRLRRLFERLAPDVLHINNGGYPGGRACQLAAISAKNAGVPRVVHFVHNTAFSPSWPHRAELALDRRVDSAVDTWVTCSRDTSVALSASRAIASTKVVTIHNGVDTHCLSATTAADTGLGRGTLRVLIVAALEQRKGHAVALRAIRELIDDGIQLAVAFAGSGSQRTAIESQIRDLGLVDHVSLLGQQKDVDSLYASADVLLLPSLSHEAFPYTILEAMAHGLPVIASGIAGIPEQIVDGVTGFVVTPGDPKAISDRLRALARAPSLRSQLGAAGRDRVEKHFSVRPQMRQLEAIWRG